MTSILIVDDNKDITGMLSKYLVMKGHECTTSNDGVIGLNLIKNGQNDHIILDISMPNFSGLDVIDVLEKEGILKDKKITIVTASDMKSNKIEMLVAKDGINTVLKKPVEIKELLTVLQN